MDEEIPEPPPPVYSDLYRRHEDPSLTMNDDSAVRPPPSPSTPDLPPPSFDSITKQLRVLENGRIVSQKRVTFAEPRSSGPAIPFVIPTQKKFLSEPTIPNNNNNEAVVHVGSKNDDNAGKDRTSSGEERTRSTIYQRREYALHKYLASQRRPPLTIRFPSHQPDRIAAIYPHVV